MRKQIPRKHLGSREIKEREDLFTSYARAQYEFEKIVGFEKAIEMTLEVKRDIVGYGLLSDADTSSIKTTIKRLRSLYAHVLKQHSNFRERSIDESNNSN